MSLKLKLLTLSLLSIFREQKKENSDETIKMPKVQEHAPVSMILYYLDPQPR